MSETAADHGYPRGHSETPYEYLATLSEAWPNYVVNSELITEAYIRVRYGEIPETKEEMDRITLAWGELRENPPKDVDGDDSGMDLKRSI